MECYNHFEISYCVGGEKGYLFIWGSSFLASRALDGFSMLVSSFVSASPAEEICMRSNG